MTLTLDEFRTRYKYDSATQVLQQYLDIKFEHQDCVIMFRLGDFYELFYEDAINISKLLGLTLTKRSNKEENVAMCGVPFHAASNYLPKIIEQGYKIAICEQLESPEEARQNRGSKAMVRRDVVRIITQGTLFEEGLLDSSAPHYLASLVADDANIALCWVDITTGEFNVANFDASILSCELARINPREILVSQNLASSIEEMLYSYQSRLVLQVQSYFSPNKAIRSIKEYYGILHHQGLGSLSDHEVSSIGAILQYLELTQKRNMPKLGFPKIIDTQGIMMIDSATRKGLELLVSNSGKIKGSLFDAINMTNTKSGARLLYKMLGSPLTDLTQIRYRHNLLERFVDDPNLLACLRNLMKKIGDPERIIGRISMGRASPQDLLDLKSIIDTALEAKKAISNVFGFIMPDDLELLLEDIRPFDDLRQQIEQTLQIRDDSSPEYGYIKLSCHVRVAELAKLIHDAGSIIQSLRSKYAKISGIDTLKINHNNVLGIFVEVTTKQAAKIDTQVFIHRQTTLNSARFTTAELQSLESQMTNAKSLLVALEHEIFSQLCQQVALAISPLSQMSAAISMLDVLSSLADLARMHNYVKPQMTQGDDFIIKDGRHVVVENSLKASLNTFVANSCDLSNGYIWIITGPNMAGKSTFLRQNALICIMAQIGSFVPASFAKIGIIDKLFSRIGASDDLSSGQSTFMVEMVEAANILAQASSKSLIIFDEVGRGTSTYDGVSIAWSIIEYIESKLRCRTLFATHYHELSSLERPSGQVRNYHVRAKEIDGQLMFLHQIQSGPADKSYGINVAQLAGLPPEVISRAKEILQKLETR